MAGLADTDQKLHQNEIKLTERKFDILELQTAKAQIKNLEEQLDKLLEKTTFQRRKIEQMEEEKVEFEAEKERIHEVMKAKAQ